jgi:hypothetical protein
MKLIIDNNNNNTWEGDSLIIKVTVYWLHNGGSVPGKAGTLLFSTTLKQILTLGQEAIHWLSTPVFLW